MRAKIVADASEAIRRRASCCATTSGASVRWPTRSTTRRRAEYHLLQFHAGDAGAAARPGPHAAHRRRRGALSDRQAEAGHPGRAGHVARAASAGRPAEPDARGRDRRRAGLIPRRCADGGSLAERADLPAARHDDSPAGARARPHSQSARSVIDRLTMRLGVDGRGRRRTVEQDRRAAGIAADVRVAAAGLLLARASDGAGARVRAGDRRDGGVEPAQASVAATRRPGGRRLRAVDAVRVLAAPARLPFRARGTGSARACTGSSTASTTSIPTTRCAS